MSPETESFISECSLFPGFKFTPTDEELISFYLKSKIDGSDSRAQIIPEIDLCQFEPWDLPAISVMKSNSEWFFFSSRGRRYPKGSQSKRATESGYWKATGKERTVKSGSHLIGKKRILVFHMGRAPKGARTEWIIHEYSTLTQDSLVIFRLKKNLEFPSSHKTNLKNSPNQKSASDNSSEQIVLEDKGLEEGCSKNCSSVHGSYPFLEIDSTSENPKKDLNKDCSLVEYSGSQKDDDYLDCFTEIMNDDILVLADSSSLPDLPLTISGTPSQGTANRRIRLLRKGASGLEILEEQNMSAEILKRRSVFSVRNHQMCVVWSILTLLLLLLAFSEVKSKILLSAILC